MTKIFENKAETQLMVCEIDGDKLNYVSYEYDDGNYIDLPSNLEKFVAEQWNCDSTDIKEIKVLEAKSNVERVAELWDGAIAFMVNNCACHDWSWVYDDEEDDGFINFYVYDNKCWSSELFVDEAMVHRGRLKKDGTLIIDYLKEAVEIVPLFKKEA